jgi:Kef-type K+ transport system membrane component KefB
METRRWTNPSQPQTLQIAVFLLYFDAVFAVIYGAVFNGLGLLLTVGYVAGGFGIANERRWGYTVGVTVAALGLLPWALLLFRDMSEFFELAFSLGAINLMFAIALLALLLHPQSREYQRIWFS